MARYNFIFFASALLVFILDQATKLWVKSTFLLYESRKVLPFFSLSYIENRGIAFGMFHKGGDVKHYTLLLATIIAIIAIFIMFFSSKKGSVSKSFVYGIIVGGAFGNLYDRFVRGYVIDFLDFYIGSHHWPVFNVADSFITIGILLIFYLQIFRKEEII